MIIAACGAMASQAMAKNWSVKLYGDIGVAKPMSLTTALPGLSTKSTSNAFGVDFGYNFWSLGKNSLGVNLGIGYRPTSATFNLEAMEYSYSAPASADMDGNPYIRHTSLSPMKQKITLGYFTIPIYLQYGFKATKAFGVYAEAGVGLGFRCGGKLGSVEGTAYTYGVYPEYDDLQIDAPYLNDFGERDLSGASKGTPEMKGFYASVLVGAGVQFYVAEPVSIDLGIRYNAGLTDVFTGKYDITPETALNAETAPVVYTVADGQQVRPLSDYVTKSRLNPLSIHVGVTVRF